MLTAMGACAILSPMRATQTTAKGETMKTAEFWFWYWQEIVYAWAATSPDHWEAVVEFEALRTAARQG